MPACVRDFSLLQSTQACSGAHLASYSKVRATLSLGWGGGGVGGVVVVVVKLQQHESDHSPPSGA